MMAIGRRIGKMIVSRCRIKPAREGMTNFMPELATTFCPAEPATTLSMPEPGMTPSKGLRGFSIRMSPGA
jgi:hypothetical protein